MLPATTPVPIQTKAKRFNRRERRANSSQRWRCFFAPEDGIDFGFSAVSDLLSAFSAVKSFSA
jgi:hypothetical protein